MEYTNGTRSEYNIIEPQASWRIYEYVDAFNFSFFFILFYFFVSVNIWMLV